MSWVIRWASALDAGAAQAWAALAPSRIYGTEAWSRTVPGYPPELMLAHQGGQPAAAAATFWLPEPEPRRYMYDHYDWIFGPPDATWVEWGDHTDGTALAAVQDVYPALVVGPLSGYHNELLLRDRDDPRALERWLEAIRERALQRGARAVVFPFLFLPDLERLCRGRPEIIPAMAVFDYFFPAVSSFEEYLARLGRHRAKESRREQRVFQRSGLTIEARPLPEVLSRVVELERERFRYHGRSEEIVEDKAAQMHAYAEHLAGASQLSVLLREGEVVGYSLLFSQGRVLHDFGLAVDRQKVDPRTFATFQLGYYHPIELLVAQRAGELELGPGSMHTKLARGADARGLLFAMWPLAERPAPEPAAVHAAERALARIGGFEREIAPLIADRGAFEGELARLRAFFEPRRSRDG